MVPQGARRSTAAVGAGGESACSIAASLDIVGDRWTILILRDVFRGLHRYDEFRRDLDIPRAVLADRLRRLVDGGVLAKRIYQERPVRHEYRLTEMGRELSPILVGLMQWGDRWLSEDGPPTRLVHDACGTEVDVGFHCFACERGFSPTEIDSRPGSEAASAATQSAATQSAATQSAATQSAATRSAATRSAAMQSAATQSPTSRPGATAEERTT